LCKVYSLSMNSLSPKYINQFFFWAYLLFFLSIIFSFRAISSISIGLILLFGIARHKSSGNKFFTRQLFSSFLMGCVLIFIIQCLSMIETNNVQEGFRLLERRSALVFIPLAASFSKDFFNPENRRKLLWYFSLFLCVASSYCLCVALYKYIAGAPAGVFFYHDLVKPLSQHAIQYSILVFIALLFLIEQLSKEKAVNTRIKPAICFLSFFLLLLSSKLIICFYFFYLLYFFLLKNRKRAGNGMIAFIFIGVVVAVLCTSNPIGKRFQQAFSGSSTLFMQKKFRPGIDFNGVQFRLLEWRFTFEILEEQHSWIFGNSPGDAQSILDQKYIETNMYTGTKGTGRRGFLGYHTHNQYLQTLLENGITGLLIFLFVGYSLIKMARETEGRELKAFVLLILLYCFTDAPLETQYGLIIFSFFPFFLGSSHRANLATKNPQQKFQPSSPFQTSFSEIMKQPN
jgi:O-antigen ligase